MPPSSENAGPPAGGQDELRRALTRAYAYFSSKGIVALAEKLNVGSLPGERAVRDFLGDNPSTLTREHHDSLAAAWLYSRFGRAFRMLGTKDLPAFDRLVDTLADGARTQPPGTRAAGLYFMYHGSYLKPGHFVIRVIRIDDGDPHVLAVTDTVTDMLTASEGERVATGAIIFVEKLPQILLFSDENKRGLSLIAGTDVSFKSGRLERITGGMLVMNTNSDVAYRRCLLVREDERSHATMATESGIFPWDKLNTPERERHRKAFQFLRKVHLKEAFADPIASLPDD